MTDLQHWIDRCRRRLNRGLVLKLTAEWLAVWLCAFGTLLLVTKVAWPAFWPQMLWLGLTVVPVVGWSIRRALRDGFTATDGAALLDRRLKANGLLMSVAEKPNGHWRDRLPREPEVWTAALPKVRPVRFARVMALPLAFAVVALLLPARPMPTSAAAPRRTLPAVRELPEMLAELKKAEVLDTDEAAFLQEEIDKLVESTAKAPPTPETWRKIDALRARLNDRLDRESRTLDKGRKASRKLAQAGKNGVPPLTKEQRRQLEQDLADALKRTRRGKEGGGRKAEGGKRKAEGGKRKAEGGKRKAEGGRPKAEGGKRKAEGGRRKAEGGKHSSSPKTVAKSPGKLPQPGPKTAKKQKRPSGKQPPAIDPSLLRDLAKVAKMVENLPPELQEKLRQEVLRMIQSGRLRIPDDPAVREMLMKQAQQMLEQDGRQLDELRKRFGRLAGNLEPWNRSRIRENSATQKTDGRILTNSATANGRVAGKQPDGGRGKRQVGSVSFRDVVLPPGLLDKPRNDPDSVSGKRPAVAPFQPTVPAAAKTAGDPAGDKWRALRRKVRPRNRDLVYRYFYGKGEK